MLGIESFFEGGPFALARCVASSWAGRFDPTGTSVPKSSGSAARAGFRWAPADDGSAWGGGGGVEGLGDAVGEPVEAIEATGEGTGDPGGEASDSSLMSIRVFLCQFGNSRSLMHYTETRARIASG